MAGQPRHRPLSRPPTGTPPSSLRPPPPPAPAPAPAPPQGRPPGVPGPDREPNRGPSVAEHKARRFRVILAVAGAAVVALIALSEIAVRLRAPDDAEHVTSDRPTAAATPEPAQAVLGSVPAATMPVSTSTGASPVVPVPQHDLPVDVASPPAQHTDPDWEILARSVLQVASSGCEQAGSAVTVDSRLLVTNAHVVNDATGKLCDDLHAGFADRFDMAPHTWVPVRVVAVDTYRDLAAFCLPVTAPTRPALRFADASPTLGSAVAVIGYPSFGGSQTTLTFGTFSGTTTGAQGEPRWKTDALLDSGVSGGAILDTDGHLTAIAVGGIEGDGGHLGLAIPLDETRAFLAGVRC